MQRTAQPQRRLRATALGLALVASVAACTPQMAAPVTNTTEAATTDVARPAGWAEASHSDEADPNYAVVYPQDKVNEITITIATEDWEAMQADMTSLLGEPGQGGGPGGGGAFGGNGGPPPGGGGRGGDMTPTNPMWVPATVEFNGATWTNVGVRYKGNSSLSSAWRDGSLKLPLKLDFDEFEADHPEIADQRFYGFKQLSLANGFGDASYLREVMTYDLLDEAGLVAAETAYYHVTLDYGEGPVSLGLYTAVEVIDDTVVERALGDDSGNIYEADGPAASLAAGTFDQIADSFEKENNADEADWSDVEALYTALHADLRTSDPAAWREGLEAVFDTDSFLEWLALSAAIQHWDTYGGMTHNYYLYDDPATGRLTWISWDHNLVLGANPSGRGGNGGPAGGGGGFGGGGPGGRGSTSLDKADVGSNWPLIRYLLDDPTYYAEYVDNLEAARALLDPDALAAKYQAQVDLIAPYAAQESDARSFEAAVQALWDRLRERATALDDFLAARGQ